ncbi:MAG: hypothetical protein J5767_14780 [Paludibacteraceae bacterium]|nr:hypothetical protein [Paludibacteraceae bacterium]
MSKPRLHQYDGIWYIVGEGDSRIHLSDYAVPASSLYKKRERWIPLLQYRFPTRVLHADHCGHEKGQVYYVRYIININGVIYPEWWILDHIAEVKTELDQIKTEDLLQEI